MSETITDDGYSPDDEIKTLLSEFIAETELNVHKQREFSESIGDIEQKSFTVEYREFESEGTETYGPTGMMASYEGHLGFASCLILAHCLRVGEPTHCYIDTSEAIEELSLWDRDYEDITAEWYIPKAVEIGVPETRMEARTGYEHEFIELEEIERYTRVWLSRGRED